VRPAEGTGTIQAHSSLFLFPLSDTKRFFD
jgi:hypothetical protein